jgi:hypothetical protein
MRFKSDRLDGMSLAQLSCFTVLACDRVGLSSVLNAWQSGNRTLRRLTDIRLRGADL